MIIGFESKATTVLAGTLDVLIFVLRTQAYMMLGLYSFTNTVQEEIEKRPGQAGEKTASHMLKVELSSLFRERRVGIGVLSVCVLAVVLEAVGTFPVGTVSIFPAWTGALAILDGLVAFFLVEIAYHALSRWLPPVLNQNRFFTGTVHAGAFAGCLLISGSVIASCVYSLPLCNAFEPVFFWFTLGAFWTILFISGLGGIGMIDSISNIASSHVPRGRVSNPAYMLVLLSLFLGIYLSLARNASVFGIYTGFVLLGLEVSMIVGAGLFVYSALQRKMVQRSTSLVYAFLMLGLSSLFIAYSTGQIPSVGNIINASQLPFTDAMLVYTAPLVLFAVGYTNLLFWMPRKLEERINDKASIVLAPITFFMLFSVLAVSEYAAHTFGPSIFLIQESLPGFPALLAGSAVFAVRKMKKANDKRTIVHRAIGPVCTSCGTRLQPSSSYCWHCGSKSLGLSKQEKVSFTGYATMITKKTHHRSRKKGIATLLVGGPIGYLLFGRNLSLKHGVEGPLVVTDKGVYFSNDKPIPGTNISGMKKGHYSNSLILTLKGKSPPSEVELKMNDTEGFSESVGRIIDHEEQSPMTVNA